jgi:hypothetical protein
VAAHGMDGEIVREGELSDPNEGAEVIMKVASRGDLVALIQAERPTVSPAEAFAMLDRLAMWTTGLVRTLIRVSADVDPML